MNLDNTNLRMILAKKYQKEVVPMGEVAGSQWPVVSNAAPAHAQSCVISNEGVFIHVSHILDHRSDNSDDVFQKISSETHAHSDTKRILTACPHSNNHFHIFKVIDREPGGGPLQYQNVLANTSVSRWVTGTDELEAETRTSDGYDIFEDIDRHVAKNWGTKVGKPTYTPAEISESIQNFTGVHARDMIYPNGLIYKRKRSNSGNTNHVKRKRIESN